MRDAVFSNYLVPLEDINRIAGSYLMYKQGEAICRFISEEYGDEYLLLMMENFWKEKDFRRVMELTLHEEFGAISEKWTDWLKDRYYPELGEIESASRIAGGVAGRGYSAKPAFYQHRDGERRIYYIGNQTGYTSLYSVRVDSAYRPVSDPQVLVRGERSEIFESFPAFESRIDISLDGKLAFVTKSGSQDVIHDCGKFLGSIRIHKLYWLKNVEE
jgi:hypothetical protein